MILPPQPRHTVPEKLRGVGQGGASGQIIYHSEQTAFAALNLLSIALTPRLSTLVAKLWLSTSSQWARALTGLPGPATKTAGIR